MEQNDTDDHTPNLPSRTVIVMCNPIFSEQIVRMRKSRRTRSSSVHSETESYFGRIRACTGLLHIVGRHRHIQ